MSTLRIVTIPVGPIATNTYVVYDESTREALVIDPGVEAAPVLEAIADVKVKHVLLTHAHFDHIGGVGAVVERTGAKIWVHELEKAWLADPRLNLSADSAVTSEPVVAPPADFTWQGGEELDLIGRRIIVLHTPGHSPGHVSLLLGDVLFGGDALFAGSVGRTDLPGGDPDQLFTSIRERLLTLPDSTRVLPGHGPATTIGVERATNPFLLGGW